MWCCIREDRHTGEAWDASDLELEIGSDGLVQEKPGVPWEFVKHPRWVVFVVRKGWSEEAVTAKFWSSWKTAQHNLPG